jgi:hypothetical protein
LEEKAEPEWEQKGVELWVALRFWAQEVGFEKVVWLEELAEGLEVVVKHRAKV